MQFSGLYDETNCIHRLVLHECINTFYYERKLSILCRDRLQFCFMHIIQHGLDTVVHEWNKHRIQLSKDCLVPAGIPDELFFLPQVQGEWNRNALLFIALNNYFHFIRHGELLVWRKQAGSPCCTTVCRGSRPPRLTCIPSNGQWVNDWAQFTLSPDHWRCNLLVCWTCGIGWSWDVLIMTPSLHILTIYSLNIVVNISPSFSVHSKWKCAEYYNRSHNTGYRS